MSRLPQPLYEAREQGGIAVSDRPVPRWLFGLVAFVVGWSIYYLITFGMQNAGTFPRPETTSAPVTAQH